MADRESVAQRALTSLVQRRRLRLPPAETRVDRRGFWQFWEVRERWGGADPKKYDELVQWFRGRADVPGTPRGAQVWLDLCRWCGYDAKPYDATPATDPAKLTVEHLFSQSMAGDRSVLRAGLMNLYAVEWAFNNSAEFKTVDSLAEQAFLGLRTHRNHLAFVGWANTKRNCELPSLAFLQSTHCMDTDLATPIYLSSGLRASGRTRQLFLPFGAAAGLRSGVKRARVEELVEIDGGPAPCTTADASTQTDPGDDPQSLHDRIAELERRIRMQPRLRRDGAAMGHSQHDTHTLLGQSPAILDDEDVSAYAPDTDHCLLRSSISQNLPGKMHVDTAFVSLRKDEDFVDDPFDDFIYMGTDVHRYATMRDGKKVYGEEKVGDDVFSCPYDRCTSRIKRRPSTSKADVCRRHLRMLHPTDGRCAITTAEKLTDQAAQPNSGEEHVGRSQNAIDGHRRGPKSRKLYTDFLESAPIRKPCPNGPKGATRLYVEITCPQCKKVFVDIPSESLRTCKASRCKRHLDDKHAPAKADVSIKPPNSDT